MSDIRHQMHRETEAAKVLRANLKDLVGDDDEALRDTLEGETTLHELIEAAVSDISKDVAAIEGLAAHIKKLGERKARLADRVSAVKQCILSAMEVGEIKTKETPLATVSRRRVPPSANISDEALIPAEYWKPQDPKLDKKALTDALKDKKEVPGAILNNGGETLTLKWS